MSPSVEPFNEAKYKALIDGLECSEVLFSYLTKSNDIFRIDSSFFAKKYLLHEQKLSKFPHTTLGKTGAEIKSFGAYSLNNEVEYVPDGIPFLRCLNIKNGFINDANMLFITPDAHKLLWKSEVHPNTFLLTMSGTIGNAAIADNNLNYPINSNQDIAKVHFHGKYSNQVALAFFMSRYGFYQIEREARGSVQQHVFLSQLETLRLPCFCELLVRAIEHCVIQSYSLQKKSYQLYEEAQQMLEDHLEISAIHKTGAIVSIELLSQSFGATGRLDAEYYQEKYQAYESAVFSSASGYSFVKNEFLPIKAKCSRNLASYNYIEIGDISIGSGNASFNTINTGDLPDNAKIMTKRGDILVSTVRPNRGAVAILEQNDFLVSGAFTVLREKGSYPKEVLQVLLRTKIYKDWLLRFNVGTSYPVIKDEDVLNMPIPLLEDSIKQDVVNRVNKSASLRRQSKQLLEYARRAVEMAIEQGEDIALAWLEDELSQMEV